MNILVPPFTIVSGVEIVAPAAGSLLVDSSTLASPIAGLFLFDFTWGTDDTVANILQIAHRNAANAADIELVDQPAGNPSAGHLAVLMSIGANEKVVARMKSAGTAGKTWQARVVVSMVVS